MTTQVLSLGRVGLGRVGEFDPNVSILHEGEDFDLKNGRALSLNSLAEVAFDMLRRRINAYADDAQDFNRSIADEIGIQRMPHLKRPIHDPPNHIDRDDVAAIKKMAAAMPSGYRIGSQNFSFEDQLKVLRSVKDLRLLAQHVVTVTSAFSEITATLRRIRIVIRKTPPEDRVEVVEVARPLGLGVKVAVGAGIVGGVVGIAALVRG